MKEKIGLIAIGQAGGNIGILLKNNGFDCIFINSSKGDLETLNIDNNLKYHIQNGLGCAKDRKNAKKIAKEDFKNINSFINDKLGEKELYYIIFSTSGGTGSGISPTLANILTNALNKKVGLMAIIPSKKDTIQAQINAYECLKEIIEIEKLSSVFLIDNEKRNDLEHINKKFVNLFSKIFEYKKFETVKGNIDESEILKLLTTKGMINITTCNNRENTEKLIENIENGIFAPLENDGVIKYLGLSNGIKFDETLFKEKIGKYLDKFENTNKKYTLAVLSGLTYSYKRIEEIKNKITEEKDLITREEKNKELEALDFLKEKIGEIKEEKIEELEMDDILNMYF